MDETNLTSDVSTTVCVYSLHFCDGMTTWRRRASFFFSEYTLFQRPRYRYSEHNLFDRRARVSCELENNVIPCRVFRSLTAAKTTARVHERLFRDAVKHAHSWDRRRLLYTGSDRCALYTSTAFRRRSIARYCLYVRAYNITAYSCRRCFAR